MADFNVDVNLPSTISVDVTSPTQALATNISIPGPQGPRGEKGNPTSINNLIAENIIITGTDGNIITTSGVNTIFISGNSGYFQSAVNTLTTNLNSTGSSLNNSINNLSGLFTVYTGNLDNTYATDAQLNSTGSNLNNKITSLSGTLTSTYATISNLAATGSTLTSNINSLNSAFTGFTGNLDATYATDTQLANTGSILNTKIDNLSGYVNSQNLSISNNLVSTGSTLQSNINTVSSNLILTGNSLNSNISSLSGTLVNNYYLKSNPSGFITGINLSNYVTKTDGQFNNRPIVNGTGILLSGEAYSLNNPSGFITGVDLTSYVTISETGNFYSNSNPSGFITSSNVALTYATINNLSSTGNTLQTQINNLGNTYATTTNLISTGSTLNSSINSLSGVLTSNYATINNLTNTGSTLQNNINSLSGSSVLLYGDQSIGGTKTFRDKVYINSLYVTGTETILNTTNNNIASPYLLLNLTGGLTDGGIFFVTGSGLTGINDTGVIFGFDNVTKTWHFGQGTRLTDISTLDEVMGYHDLTGYSGYANNIFSTITNLANTGSTLQTNINTISSNLINTGSVLDGKISSLSGTLTSTYATINNLASTGLTLQTNINNLSGYINSSSSNIVFTTGNQNISGTKTFINNLEIQGTGIFNAIDLSNISDFQFSGTNINLIDSNIYVSGNGTIYISGNPVLTGVNLSNYATITNLASTGSTLEDKIGSLSGALTNNYVTKSNGQFNNRPTVNGTGVLLSGEAAGGSVTLPSGILYTSGTQTISGSKTFTSTGIFNSGIDLNNSNLINVTPEIINVSSNFNISGNYSSRMIMANSAAEITGTIVSGNPLGFNTTIIQIGSGQILITGLGNGIIINEYASQYRTAGRFAAISILHTGNNGYIMYGNTGP